MVHGSTHVQSARWPNIFPRWAKYIFFPNFFFFNKNLILALSYFIAYTTSIHKKLENLQKRKKNIKQSQLLIFFLK